MLIICDTHILIFWQDAPNRFSEKAKKAFDSGLEKRNLACSDISFWEIAMLIRTGRLRSDISSSQYINDLTLALSLSVLPMTAEIASLSQQDFFIHKAPADRLIAATAICNNAPLISADQKLQDIEQLKIIWLCPTFANVRFRKKRIVAVCTRNPQSLIQGLRSCSANINVYSKNNR